jgi:choline transport protein
MCTFSSPSSSDSADSVPRRLFFFIVFIALLATSNKASAKDVWGTFINDGGWDSDGVSFCLGFLTPAFALAGVDAVVHMSEETHNAPINIPRAMIGAVIINGLAGFAYIITILYCITDADTVLSAPFPILVVFQEATGSQKASTAMLSGIITIFSFALFGVYASSSRLVWAFSRDRGLPASRFFSRITEWNKAPTNAVLLCFVVTTLLSLINIGSYTAFNAFLSLATIGFYFSYGLPILLFFIRRFNHANPIKFGPWKMSRMVGMVNNVLALMFCTFLIIFLPFPSYLPVTAKNMNYAAPIFIGVMGFAIIFYFVYGHKNYVGPIKETGSETSSQSDVPLEHQSEVMDEKTRV